MSRVASYSVAHDKILKQFRRASLYLVWVAVFSVLALLFYVPSYLQGHEAFGLGGVFNAAAIASLFLAQALGASSYGFIAALVSFDAVLGAALGVLGYLAHRGKPTPLLLGIGLYGVDALLLTLSPLQSVYAYRPIDYLLSLIVHLVGLTMCGVALYKRHQLVALAAERRKSLDLPSKDPEATVHVLSYHKSKRELQKRDVFADTFKGEGEADK